jgi:hypothetical protein
MTDEAVSPLRRRMIEDMTIRKFAPKTQHDYVQRVKNFAAFLGRSPDTASFEDVRRIFSLPFLLYRTITEDRILQAELPGFGLRRAGPMAARPGHLVRAKPHLGKHAPHQIGP